MATWFGCDPLLATASSKELAQISSGIQPVAQWLSGVDSIGVEQVASALGGFAAAAGSFTSDLTARIDGASGLLGALGTGARAVDWSLLVSVSVI